LEKERIDRHRLEKKIALKKKTEETYEMEKTKWKQKLEKEQARKHSLKAKRSLLRKQEDNNKVEIKRLKL